MEHEFEETIAYSHLGRQSRGVDSVITRLMASKLEHPELLSLAAGFTDNEVLPAEIVTRAVEALGEKMGRTHLQYGTNRGREGLRRAVRDLLRSYPGEDGLELDEKDVLITNGSQQALYIIVQMLCDPGDLVLVERPSYFVFLELLKGMGVEAISIPEDGSGKLDAEALGDLIGSLREKGELERLKLVYLMGTFANPSTRSPDEDEKEALAGILQGLERPVPVIEDMAYRELYFENPAPARSLLSLPSWEGYPILYLGTFTKPFATGLKVGFVVSPDSDCLETLAKIKGHQDFGTAHFNQAILEWMLLEGFYADHLSMIRRHYLEKARVLEATLVEGGLREAGWSWESPKGGLLLWAKGPKGIDTRIEGAFHRRCLEKEILYVPGDLCFAEGYPHDCVRLSFGALEASLLPEAGNRFCEAALI